MTLLEAAKRARNALADASCESWVQEEIDALDAAIAEAEKEQPVAWLYEGIFYTGEGDEPPYPDAAPLYLHPKESA